MADYFSSAPLGVMFVLLIAGFALLIKGADYFVEGSSSIAKRFHVPSLIIGLTIVAMGTSLPETAVSVTASVVGNNALAVSNAVGSNIFNLMVVIGVCVLFADIPVEEETVKFDIPVSALCALLVLAGGIVGFADASPMTLGHVDGAILIVFFAAYILWLVRKAISSYRESEGESAPVDDALLPVVKSLVYIVLGGVAIAIGGDLTVESASRIAISFGMSQTLVGLTIVSIGTSLPELVTSMVAAKKNEVEMALGNAIGSNVFNFLMVLGIASAISPISFLRENVIDIIILLAFTVIVWVFAATRRNISRREGIIMLAMYAIYAVYICIR